MYVEENADNDDESGHIKENNVEIEGQVQSVWNILPMTDDERKRNIVPLSHIYTYTNSTENMCRLYRKPIMCSNSACKAYMNADSLLSNNGMEWSCNFCMGRNKMQDHGNNADIQEIFRTDVLEYVFPSTSGTDQVVFFVVDGFAFDVERFELQKKCILEVLNTVPDNFYVGVVKYGPNISLLSLLETDGVERWYIFPDGNYTHENLRDTLVALTMKGAKTHFSVLNTFVRKKAECHEHLSRIIGEMQEETYGIAKDTRKLRCTGSALSLVNALLDASFVDSGGMIMLFVQGACTLGPGKVVSPTKDTPMRSNMHIEKNIGCRYSNQALAYYEKLSHEIAKNGCAVAIVSTVLEDIGIMELAPLANNTGGTIIFEQDFEEDNYIGTAKKIFSRCEDGVLSTKFNSTLTVRTNKKLFVNKLIGLGNTAKCLAPVQQDPHSVKIWTGMLMPGMAYVFDTYINDADRQTAGHIQISIIYKTSQGNIVCRVVTAKREQAVRNDKSVFAEEFDSITALAVVAKKAGIATKKPGAFITYAKNVDNMLVWLAKRFSTYNIGNPESVLIEENIIGFLEMVFFFRRYMSMVSQVNTVDEAAFTNHLFLRENTENLILLIRPMLIGFSLEKGRCPTTLDIDSVNDSDILLLDSFTHILVWKSAKAVWLLENTDFDDPNEKKAALLCKKLYDAAVEEAEVIQQDRYPIPKYIVTSKGDPDERLLLVKISPPPPGDSANTDLNTDSDMVVIRTDDIDIGKFYEFICKHITNKEK